MEPDKEVIIKLAQIEMRQISLEQELKEIDKRIIKQGEDLQAIKTAHARWGGIIVTLSAIGGFAAWLFTQFKGYILP